MDRWIFVTSSSRAVLMIIMSTTLFQIKVPVELNFGSIFKFTMKGKHKPTEISAAQNRSCQVIFKNSYYRAIFLFGIYDVNITKQCRMHSFKCLSIYTMSTLNLLRKLCLRFIRPIHR